MMLPPRAIEILKITNLGGIPAFISMHLFWTICKHDIQYVDKDDESSASMLSQSLAPNGDIHHEREKNTIRFRTNMFEEQYITYRLPLKQKTTTS